MELRCPRCLSPEVGPRADGADNAMRCDNCGERFERDEAFVSVADVESHVPDPVTESLFKVDASRARDELGDICGALEAVTPYSDAEELNHLLDAAQARGVVRAARPGAWIHVHPKSMWVPDPLLVVDPGDGSPVLGPEPTLRQEGDEGPVDFSARVLMEMVDEANSLVAGRAADSERLDRVAAFLNAHRPWSGGDIRDFLAEEIVASGRLLLEAEE